MAIIFKLQHTILGLLKLENITAFWQHSLVIKGKLGSLFKEDHFYENVPSYLEKKHVRSQVSKLGNYYREIQQLYA